MNYVGIGKQIKSIQSISTEKIQLYENRLSNTIKAGDALYNIFQQERVNSLIKDNIIDQQHKAIEELIKRINEINRIRKIDPRLIA